MPISAGIPQSTQRRIHCVNFNDLDSVEYVLRRHPVACVLLEPVLQNVGVVRYEALLALDLSWWRDRDDEAIYSVWQSPFAAGGLEALIDRAGTLLDELGWGVSLALKLLPLPGSERGRCPSCRVEEGQGGLCPP